jgi:D-psicose/D-tagatose/L-ribulose 3-epimerase
MQLSVSQIAWESGQDPVFLDLLESAGFHHVDIAPTKIWPDWSYTQPSPQEFRTILAGRKAACSGMQSLFFGTKGLNVFGDDTAWKGLAAHFEGICTAAGELGVKAVVFGAPANRDPGENAGDIMPKAFDRFGALGDIAAKAGTCLCLEPVPADLGSRFLRTTGETAAFARKLAHPAVKMNLDTAVLAAEGCDAAQVRAAVLENMDVIGHVHASEPQLGSFHHPVSRHADMGAALREANYTGGMAIEMRAGATPEQSRANLIEALAFVAGAYRAN